MKLEKMGETIVVGISDIKIAQQGDILVTYSLGSCVGVCLYDNMMKIAGLAHIMLPSSQGFSVKPENRYRFADLAIPALIREMEKAGAKKFCIKAKIAGGAQMFLPVNQSNVSNIGEKNILAVKTILAQRNIPVLAAEIGKNYSRTQIFSSADGSMMIRTGVNDLKKY